MWLPVAAVAGAAAGTLAWAVRGRSAQLLAPSVWRFPAGSLRVALTFDDGPSESTPQLLELLGRAGARATFFVCGANAARLPELTRAIVREGHELGNHSWSHLRFDFTSRARMRTELLQTQELLRDLTGSAPRWFRPPFGVRWFGMGGVQQALGLQCAMWTVIGRDWRLPGPAIARRVLSRSSDGAIVCLHDGRQLQNAPDIANTIAAVEEILPAFAARHLSITSVSAMLER